MSAHNYAGITLCLNRLQIMLACSYCQWLIENPSNHDYEVVASINPEGEIGYDVAHRTGVIGQVFRRQEPMFVAHTNSHPFYDVFDNNISWELCAPIFSGQKLAAVINLEGVGHLKLQGDVWTAIDNTVYENTTCRLPPSIPAPDVTQLVPTCRLVIPAHICDKRSNVAAAARALAACGPSTLLVGNYPELLAGRSPDMGQAAEQNLGASYCYFGVAPNLDLLATGSFTEEDILNNRMYWWDISKGRYAFVLVHIGREVPLA